MNGIACALTALAATYVGGELPGSAEQAYEEHFMDCEDCLCAVEVWRAMVQGLRERDQAMQPGLDPRGSRRQQIPVRRGPRSFAYILARIGSGKDSEGAAPAGSMSLS
jgi:anti-sigma factor RsiW